MRSNWYFPLALTVTFALLNSDPVHALPVNADVIGMAAPAPDLHLVLAVRGPRGGVAARGPRGGVGVRGPRGGVAVRGPRGGVAARGPRGRVAIGPRGVAIGRRAYGGVWYGTGRRFWGGRWWPYGVGSCWRPSPIGFVWVCG
jgi:hypothetical protein